MRNTFGGIQFNFPMDNSETKAVSAVEVRYRNLPPLGFILLDAENILVTNGNDDAKDIIESQNREGFLNVGLMTKFESLPRSDEWSTARHAIPFKLRVGANMSSLGVVVVAPITEPDEVHDIASVCIEFGESVQPLIPDELETKALPQGN